MLENQKITENDIVMSPRVYKPWEITDDIINKIPKINYYGLTKEQSEGLNIIVKKTLEEIRNDNIDREVALVYDLNGFINIMFRTKYLYNCSGDKCGKYFLYC